jgi:hypothetical protein
MRRTGALIMTPRASRLLLGGLVNCLLVIGSVVFFFAATEAFLWAYGTLQAPSAVVSAPSQSAPPVGPTSDITIPPALVERAAQRHALLTMPDEWKRKPVVVPGANNATMWQGSVEVENQYGMRWASPFPEKRPDIYRVLVIGDSLTYGQGIAEQDTFTALLNQWMGQDYRIEFLNLGVPGAQSADILRMTKKFVPELKADLVIYPMCLNDFLNSGQGEYSYSYPFPLPDSAQKFFLAHTRTGPFVAQLYDSVLRRFHFRRDFYDDILNGFGGYEPRFRQDVTEMNSFVQGAGLPPVVAMVVDQYPSHTGKRYQIVRSADEAMRAAHMDVIPIEGYIRRYDGHAMYVSRWEGHPDEQANFIWATMIMRKLRERPDIQAFRK